MKSEINALRQLDHPNIMKIEEAKLDVSYIDLGGIEHIVCYIASELVENGELFDYVISPNRGPIPERVAK